MFFDFIPLHHQTWQSYQAPQLQPVQGRHPGSMTHCNIPVQQRVKVNSNSLHSLSLYNKPLMMNYNIYNIITVKTQFQEFSHCAGVVLLKQPRHKNSDKK